MDVNECENGVSNEEIRTEMLSSSDSSESPLAVLETCMKKSSLPDEIKLEGWLKLAVQGFRKTVKQLWFVYGEDTGKLYYYQHPHDVMPMGEIDLKQSSLTYDASNRDKPGLFEIRSGGKTYSIDAQESQHMFKWLDALQQKRRAFSLKQSELAQDLFFGRKKHIFVSGLLGQASADLNRESIESMESLHTNIEVAVSTSNIPVTGKGRPNSETSGKSNSDSSGNPSSDSPGKPNSDSSGNPSSDSPGKPNSDASGNPSSESPGKSSSDSPGKSNSDSLGKQNSDSSGKPNSDSSGKPNSDLSGKPNSNSPGRPNSDLSYTPNEDWILINDCPLPPCSLPLVNNLSTQWHVNFDESSVDSKDGETPFINPESHHESEHGSIFTSDSNICQNVANQSSSSATLTANKSKSLSFDDIHSPTTNAVSPSFINATNGKLKFISVLKNNFKIMKDTVKEKKMNLIAKQTVLTSPENALNTALYCYRCKTLGDELLSVKEELKTTEEELNANRAIAGQLQKEVDVMKAGMSTRKDCEKKSEEEIMQVLHLKDKHIVELEHSLAALLEEKNMLVQEQRSNDNTLKNLGDQISMFQQTLAVKDEMIISLTNTNQELNNTINPGLTIVEEKSDGIFPNNSTSVTVDRKELERLNDMCKAYEDQNKFLTNEILELNALRQDDETRERLLRLRIDNLEAQFCQLSSKYLYLLNEIQTPVRGGDENKNQDIVNQLIQEALESETESQDVDENQRAFTSSQGKEYDCYGFLKFGHEDGNVLVTRAKILQRKSLEIEYQIRDADEEISKQIKWENFMVGLSPNKHLVRSTDIKFLLRQGVPHQYREKIWKGCNNLYVRQTRIKLGNKYYKHLEERAKNNKSNPAIKQIELDLLRTLPDNKYFDKIDSPGIKKLRRILLSYSIHNPLIGYCQGINRIAAIALLFLCEEDAFWCLVAVTEHLMPADYYTVTLAGAQADQRVLKDLVQEKCPKLFAHLEANDVDLSFFTFNWFLTVFVDGVNPELFLRVWDVFLYEGSKVLFRFALAFLKYGEDEILKQLNNLTINRYMRMLGETITDVRRIYTIAFSELNPFPMRSISSKRQYHLQQVKLELEELEKIRRELRSTREESEQYQDRQDDLSEDEIDDEG